MALKELNITYEEIQLLREAIIEEMRGPFTTLTVEHLKLVEMRIQTILMAGGIGHKDIIKKKYDLT